MVLCTNFGDGRKFIMKFSNEFYEYLSGGKFSSTYSFKIEDESRIVSRTECLINLLKGKKVIHVGCCDHLDTIQKRIEKKEILLHDILLRECGVVIGIDNDEHACALLTDELKYEGIFCGDIDSDAKKLKTLIRNTYHEKFDYILLGEVLEHLDNPVHFVVVKQNCNTW